MVNLKNLEFEIQRDWKFLKALVKFAKIKKMNFEISKIKIYKM